MFNEMILPGESVLAGTATPTLRAIKPVLDEVHSPLVTFKVSRAGELGLRGASRVYAWI